LPLFIKVPLKEGFRLFAFLPWAFGVWVLGGFGLGFGLILLLWAFWCGKLWEGKRITEGKRIAKGKSMAKEELIGSLHKNFNTGLRKAKPKKEF
jgi:hypothetical protein